MKRLATVIAVSALIGTPAFAADMAVKAPPSPPPAPVYNWTGFYVGGNIGASFGRAKTDFNVAPVTGQITGGVNDGGRFEIPGFGFSNNLYPDGFIGGGQIGYNWQFSPIWIVGLEADFQGAAERDGGTLTYSFSDPIIFPADPPPLTVNSTAVINYHAEISWFGTARLRAGYLWGNGTVLSYLTGGLAYGKVDIEGTNTVSGTVPDSTPFSITHAFGHSHVNTGWVVGSGTEGLLAIPGWTYKIEWLYMDLGSLDDSDRIAGDTTVSGGQTHIHTHFTDNIIRLGVNYQFH